MSQRVFDMLDFASLLTSASALVLLAAIGIGLVMGLTGAGGGILAVPVLVILLGWPMQKAAQLALIAVAATASIATIEGLLRGVVRYRAATVMALAGIPIAAVAVRVAAQLPQQVLMITFACVLLLVALRQLTSTTQFDVDGPDPRWPPPVRLNPATGRFVWNSQSTLVFFGIGAVTGFASGLLGVGGGFVMVPLLTRFTRLEQDSIVGTSLMVMAIVTSGAALSSLVAHSARATSAFTADASVAFAVAFVVLMVIGMFVGRRIAQRIAVQLARRVFSVLLIVAAALLLLR